jgi:DNA-directed RNA polymerase subunit RPC12/RpoP
MECRQQKVGEGGIMETNEETRLCGLKNESGDERVGTRFIASAPQAHLWAEAFGQHTPINCLNRIIPPTDPEIETDLIGAKFVESNGMHSISCPYCRSTNTEFFSLFGQQLLTEQYYCNNCHTPFEHVF